METVDFLSQEVVLFVHADQMHRYGGDPNLRDLGLLESALAQPPGAFAGRSLHEFPHEMAAANLYYIVQNHPFMDGNQRTGALSARLFLALNGFDVDAPIGALYDAGRLQRHGR
jgi:death-on-curing protein